MSTEGGAYGFYTRQANGTGSPSTILDGEPGNCCSVAAWSPDGTTILYSTPSGDGREIRAATTDVDGSPRPVVNEAGGQSEPRWSPDGQHFVYQSQQTGDSDPEIYVRPFPDSDSARIQVSLSGGWEPRWSGNWRTIYYASDEGIMAVDFESGPDPSEISVGQPVLALEMTGVQNFDVSRDGEMFVITRDPIEAFATDINIVLNWFEELKERVRVP
jgi:Tol biopolymer transport system component